MDPGRERPDAGSRMRILHTVQYYAPDNGGGAAEVVRRVSEGLVARGHDVTIATSLHPARTRFEDNGVKIAQFSVHSVLRQSVLGIYGDVAGYHRFLKEGRFDVIMNYAAQTWHADLTYRVLGTLRAKTVLAACGYSGLLPPRSLLYRRYFRELPKHLRKYDSIVYHSPSYQDKRFGDDHAIGNYRIIPNGFDSQELERATVDFRSQYGIQTKHMILTVGDHFSNKGHRRVLEAFRLLARDDVTLVIVGRRVAAPFRSCWRRCSRTGRQGHGAVVMVSDAPRSHVIAAYRAADVFVSGSYVEAFPLVIIESMAAAVPFVAFPAGNIHELSGGVVVQSSQEMARKVGVLLDDRKLRGKFGDEGRAEQRAKYEWREIVTKYERLYAELVQG